MQPNGILLSLSLSNRFFDSWEKRYCPTVLNAWKIEVIHAIDQRIEQIVPTLNLDPLTETLQDPNCKEYLSYLHSQYVIAPIDKATGNVALICKRFYAEVLIKELGLYGSGSETYTQITRNEQSIVDLHKHDLKTNHNIDVSDENECLPSIYWLPKLHKNPLKFRFIIAAPKCSVKPLSKAVTSVFLLFYNQIENYHMKCCFYSSVKTFWVIENNHDVLNSLNKINRKGKANCISTYDFSTLYTKIPHNKLVQVLNEITDVCFNGGNRDVLSGTKSGARWVTKPSLKGITFTKDSFKEAVLYLMENCFFTLGDHIFRQIIGIPMGSDPAPFMANLFFV